MLEETRTDIEVIATLRKSNVFCCRVVHVYVLLVSVMSKSRQVMSKKPQINC